MFTKQNIADILAGQHHGQFSLIYGVVKSAISHSPDWSEVKVADDTGEISVWVPSNMINISSTLVEECVTIANTSGKSVIFANPGQAPVITVGALADMTLRKGAFNVMKELTGTDCNAAAGAAALAQMEDSLTSDAVQVGADAASAPECSAPNPQVGAPLALQAVAPSAPPQMQGLSKPYASMSAAYVDCLEAATVTLAEFQGRHPQIYGMLCSENIRQLATTFFIESNRR